MRNFAAIDFETANGKRTSICSVGVVIVKEGKIINNDMLRPSSDDTERILNTLEGI